MQAHGTAEQAPMPWCAGSCVLCCALPLCVLLWQTLSSFQRVAPSPSQDVEAALVTGPASVVQQLQQLRPLLCPYTLCSALVNLAMFDTFTGC